MSVTRRHFAATLASLPLFSAESKGWALRDQILARIKAPSFPKKDFPIAKYGKSPAAAVAACAKAGGGRVVVPAGEWATGPIHLKSNVHLYLEKGATLKFDTDPQKYLPVVLTRWEGLECMNYSPLIYAYGQTNIAVTGEGTLDGQADNEHWWPWKGRRGPGDGRNQNKARLALAEMGERDVPAKDRVFGEGSYLRPNFIQPYQCRNVLIEGVTIVGSPMWEIHPLLCSNVIVRGVKINSHGPNNDGCDPESCSDVLIEGCQFDTGDDCIAIKSGRNRDGRRIGVPSENMIIRNCDMKDGHGGVTIGSEISGGCRNVFVEDCRMDSPHLDRVLRLKTNSVRGGYIEDIYLRNVTVGQVAAGAIDVDLTYEEGDKGKFPPVIRGIHVEKLTVKKMRSVLYLRGYASAPIKDLTVKDSVFESAAKPDTLEHVEGLKMTNVKVNGKDVSN